ncbi:MAG TPA: VanW family protein [Candidatus Saccharimonadales bacterium]|nr:VanW family protein [Candidatus Saccharimonadales bacterium]
MVGELRITMSHVIGGLIGLMILGVIAVVGFTVAYQGKIYPGVSADGLYLGGLSRTAAEQALATQAAQYVGEKLSVNYNHTSLTIPIKSLAVSYSNVGVMAALDYGRQGSFAAQVRDRLRALFGRSATFADYSYNDAALEPSVNTVDAAVVSPVANASLGFANDQVTVQPSQAGQRLDDGLLIKAVESQLATMGAQPITAPVYLITPSISADTLEAVRSQAEGYVTGPLTITANGATQSVSQSQILSWVDPTTATNQTDLPLNPLTSFYPQLNSAPGVNLTLDPTKVGEYVAALAGSIDQPAQNAVLSWQNNAPVVTQASHPGLSLDQTKATQVIMTALNQAGASRTLTLPTAATPATVNETDLPSLGINTLISSGNTTFPGSSAARITNVTVGAAKFNNVLLSPGQEFSFGQLLGPVGPAQGYLPGLVILGNEETDQYGGGLCQVATTAFRAALLAGLPINERSNHSYAVSFYTAPYGVPGVDATIYYPQVDLKFTNDTGHYILIQTSISGDSLTFNFYGTKTKTGVIIPPHFIYGTTNAAQASETQFQRQVLNLSGQVIKTDTFTQYYQPSTDFPIVQTSNGA